MIERNVLLSCSASFMLKSSGCLATCALMSTSMADSSQNVVFDIRFSPLVTEHWWWIWSSMWRLFNAKSLLECSLEHIVCYELIEDGTVFGMLDAILQKCRPWQLVWWRTLLSVKCSPYPFYVFGVRQLQNIHLSNNSNSYETNAVMVSVCSITALRKQLMDDSDGNFNPSSWSTLDSSSEHCILF